MKIVIINRSPWKEKPRMRKQLSLLLRDCGHEIHYVQFTRRTVSKIPEFVDGITVYQYKERIDFRLRISFLNRINTWMVKRPIKYLLESIQPDLIINFNIDYYFLRRLTPIKIITFVNDDYISQAKSIMKYQAKWWYTQTLGTSDLVLTVSYPLQKLLRQYAKNVQLFFFKISIAKA